MASISSGWSFPTEFATEPRQRRPYDDHIPGNFEEEDCEQRQPEEVPGTEAPAAPEPLNTDDDVPPRQRRKHYANRQCRICLEVVPPTFEQEVEGIAAMLDPGPRVTYISEDPESGRMIRPCKCKGTQRYVHEGCLTSWRNANLGARRNYYECPTCKFKYRMERLKLSAWIQGTVAQILLTLSVFLVAIFILGFIADPIINLYLDPLGAIGSIFGGSTVETPWDNYRYDLDDEVTWLEHFLKGFASVGLLGMFKAIFAVGPWNWFNLRRAGLFQGGGRRANHGRDRLENLSWTVVVIGVLTVLYGLWQFVRNWSRSTLQAASDRVVDVKENEGDDDDGEEMNAD